MMSVVHHALEYRAIERRLVATSPRQAHEMLAHCLHVRENQMPLSMIGMHKAQGQSSILQGNLHVTFKRASRSDSRCDDTQLFACLNHGVRVQSELF